MVKSVTKNRTRVGTYAEMIEIPHPVEGDEFIVDSGSGSGSKYEYRGNIAGWCVYAAKESPKMAVGQDDIQDLTMNDAAQVVTLPAGVAYGAGQIEIYNEGATTENIRFAWGTSWANAQAGLTMVGGGATTGVKVPVYADKGDMCRVIEPVPHNATHLAVANTVSGHTQAVQVIPRS